MTNREQLLRLKVDRANQHINDLADRAKLFWQENPPEAFAEDQTEPGWINCRVVGIGTIPREWRPLVGDILHNLRSALDHLAAHLTESNGEAVTDDTGFPISKDLRTFLDTRGRKVSGISDHAWDALKGLKPYHGGNDHFWRLHRLNIADKHRLLVPIVARYRSLGLDMSRFLSTRPEWPTPQELVVNLVPHPLPPLEDGDSFFRVSVADWPHVDQNPKPTLTISFGDVEPARSQPVDGVFSESITVVNQAIDALAPFLKD